MYIPSNERLLPIHEFLVKACETERGLPSVINTTLKTLWPETASEKHVDYKPDRTRITFCKPTGKQIDQHSRALSLVVEAIKSPEERKIVWAVASSSAFRERGPKWTKLVQKFKGMGMGYPKHVKTLRRKYEEALLSILCLQLTRTSFKQKGYQCREKQA